ncbi:MAG: metalloregulator ArsR/SmtB family transcription factor [Melioribacteraceae bacterium]
MKPREFKDLTFDLFAKVANSFASPKRLEIIDLLSQGERDVDSLSKETNMNFANTSRHLQILKSANIVKTRKDGVRVFYSLSNNEVIQCWKNLQTLTEKTASEIREVSRLFFEERDSLEPIGIDDLRQKLEKDEVTLIDVRPNEEFQQGHLPKAVSFPLVELRSNIRALNSDKEIVAYCRGPYCVLAAEAVKLLKEKGFTITLFKEDVNSWRAQGLPVQT